MIFTKESLENLRQKVNILELVQSYVEMKPAGASYKGLCPFHDERTPSFQIGRGDAHYHCFGCGAHGDAIQFLMDFNGLNFTDAVQQLADRFGVTLECVEKGEKYKGINKRRLKEAMGEAARFYHFYLMRTQEGHQALKYLFNRGLNQKFIEGFEFGFAPKEKDLFQIYMKEKGFSKKELAQCGLVKEKDQGTRDFFYDRITIPIKDALGGVIGFTARKWKEETFGGKYVNTPETPLFKKSRVLFGLPYCRRRIAKEQQALIVEGQLDALRLIEAGITFTVSGQGTAFGQEHAQELLNLGIKKVYLAFDADQAGKEATRKVGDLFQKEGIEVLVIDIPYGKDPDTLLQQEGKDKFLKRIEVALDYLTFLVHFLSEKIDVTSPAGKSQVVREVTQQIKSWGNRLMEHESLKKLAELLSLPQNVLMEGGMGSAPRVSIRTGSRLGEMAVPLQNFLEKELLRFLLLLAQDEGVLVVAKANISPETLKDPIYREIYSRLLEVLEEGSHSVNFSLYEKLETDEARRLLDELTSKKMELKDAKAHLEEAVRKLLERNWMERREAIKMKLHSGELTDDEALEMVKEFDRLKSERPKVLMPESWKGA